MFRRVDVPVLGIIENMSYFIAPDTGKRYDIFGHGGARQEAERLDTPFLGEVPLDMVIRETSDAGTPIVVAEPNGSHAAAFREHRHQGVGGRRREPPRGAEVRDRIGVLPARHRPRKSPSTDDLRGCGRALCAT